MHLCATVEYISPGLHLSVFLLGLTPPYRETSNLGRVGDVGAGHHPHILYVEPPPPWQKLEAARPPLLKDTTQAVQKRNCKCNCNCKMGAGPVFVVAGGCWWLRLG